MQFMRSCDLIIMDAGPLIKLALVDRLDLLLSFNLHVYIPDEVYFEAAEKYAWEHEVEPGPEALLLAEWVDKQESLGRVSRPATLVGESAKKRRDSGEYSPEKKNHRRNTGELAAHDFFNNRDSEGHGRRPALVLIDDGPAVDKIRLQNLDEHVLSTFAMLIAFEEEQKISSAEAIWSDIENQIPNVLIKNFDESIRGDTEYRERMRV